MTPTQSGGYKLEGVFGLQHELTRKQKTAGSAWTPLPARVNCLKPPEIAVRIADASGLFGGRSSPTATHEHATHGGTNDE